MTESDSEGLEAIDIYRTCDACTRGPGEFDAGITREIMGGDGKLCAVMLCAACLERFKTP